MNTKKLLMSLGATIATSQIAKSISNVTADDMLGTVGLARRRSHLLENIGLVALGAAAGAGVALLLAPESGTETRRRIGRKMDELGEKASEAAQNVRHQLPNLESMPSTSNQGNTHIHG